LAVVGWAVDSKVKAVWVEAEDSLVGPGALVVQAAILIQRRSTRGPKNVGDEDPS